MADYAAWRWIFWLLTLLSGTCLLLITLFLPETSRSIVGNGSLNISGPLHRSMISYFHRREPSRTPEDMDREEKGEQEAVGLPSRRIKFRLPNPLTSLKLLWAKHAILIILIFGIFYMNLSCVQASTSTLFIDIYRISQLKAGLVYLPAGVGSVIGAYSCGRLCLQLPRFTHALDFNVVK